jgi:hypothetical protein
MLRYAPINTSESADWCVILYHWGTTCHRPQRELLGKLGAVILSPSAVQVVLVAFYGPATLGAHPDLAWGLARLGAQLSFNVFVSRCNGFGHSRQFACGCSSCELLVRQPLRIRRQGVLSKQRFLKNVGILSDSSPRTEELDPRLNWTPLRFKGIDLESQQNSRLRPRRYAYRLQHM